MSNDPQRIQSNAALDSARTSENPDRGRAEKNSEALRAGDDGTAASLAADRSSATTAERQVLALEMIADRLTAFAGVFSRRASTVEQETPDTPTGGSEGRAGDRWENEGGSSQPQLGDDPDIERTVVEIFRVGQYKYTDLEHAIAEAKRARRAVQHPA